MVRFERRCKHCVLVLDILGLLLLYGTYEYRGTWYHGTVGYLRYYYP